MEGRRRGMWVIVHVLVFGVAHEAATVQRGDNSSSAQSCQFVGLLSAAPVHAPSLLDGETHLLGFPCTAFAVVPPQLGQGLGDVQRVSSSTRRTSGTGDGRTGGRGGSRDSPGMVRVDPRQRREMHCRFWRSFAKTREKHAQGCHEEQNCRCGTPALGESPAMA